MDYIKNRIHICTLCGVHIDPSARAAIAFYGERIRGPGVWVGSSQKSLFQMTFA
jgi:hypothetical protein